MSVQQSIVVEEVPNPRYCPPELTLEYRDQGKAADTEEVLYRVVSRRNCLEPRIGEYLRPSKVQSLILAGVSVTFKGLK